MIPKKSNNRIGIAHIFWFYWAVLVAWQNLSVQTVRSGGDLVLKIGLIALLTVFYFSRAHKVSVNIVTICLFALTMLCSWLLSGDSISAGNLISYSYPERYHSGDPVCRPVCSPFSNRLFPHGVCPQRSLWI